MTLDLEIQNLQKMKSLWVFFTVFVLTALHFWLFKLQTPFLTFFLTPFFCRSQSVQAVKPALKHQTHSVFKNTAKQVLPWIFQLQKKPKEQLNIGLNVTFSSSYKNWVIKLMAAPQLETQPCLWQKITFLLLVFLNSRGTQAQGKGMALLPVNLSLALPEIFPQS